MSFQKVCPKNDFQSTSERFSINRQLKIHFAGLTYSTLSLLSTVVFLLLSVHLNGWKLDRRLGIILMIWYFLFISLASMYEFNVFGPFNPPACKGI